MKLRFLTAVIFNMSLVFCVGQLRADHEIFKAIFNNKIDKALELVDNPDFDSNVRNSFGATPLHYGASFLYIFRGSANEKAKLFIDKLLKKGADINAKNVEGLTPLQLAWEYGSEIVSLFIECYKKAGKVDVFAFIEVGMLDEALKMIRSEGFNPQIRDSGGNTPFHLVATYLLNKFVSQEEFDKARILIEELLKKGVQIDAKNSDGITPLGLAGLSEKVFKLFEEFYIRAGKQKVYLTKYKTEDGKDFKCKRVAIFINDDPKYLEDPIFLYFTKAILQRCSPIIVSRPLLRMFFEGTGVNDLLDNWLIYSRKGDGNDSYYLLIPKIVAEGCIAQEMFLKLGFDQSLQGCTFNAAQDINDDRSGLKRRGGDFFKDEDKKSFFTKDLGPWDIYLMGHGSMGGFIAGVNYYTFDKFLDFLSKDIQTNFLFYSTCYGGGINLVTPYVEKVSYPSGDVVIKNFNINFTIAQQAVTEQPVRACTIKDDYFPIPNFKVFFEAVESIFNNEPKSFNKWNELFESVIELKLCFNEPLIRFPGVKFFQVHAFSERVEILNQVGIKAKALDNVSMNITDKKEVLLLYPPIIPVPLSLPSNDEFKIISMNPEDALHFFKEIRSKSFKDYRSSLGSSFWLECFKGKKIFIIKRWLFDNGYEFSDVVITFEGETTIRDQALGRGEADLTIKSFFKIEKSPVMDEVGKYKFFDLKRGFTKELSKEEYQEDVFDILKYYKKFNPLLRDAQGNFVVPWQEEPRVLVEFVMQELGISQGVDAKLQAKIDAMKIRFFYDEVAVSRMRQMLKIMPKVVKALEKSSEEEESIKKWRKKKQAPKPEVKNEAKRALVRNG